MLELLIHKSNPIIMTVIDDNFFKKMLKTIT